MPFQHAKSVRLKTVSSGYICILFAFSTEQKIIFSYCMPCMQVGLPLYWLSIPHIIDFFLRETGRTERDHC